MRSLRRWVMVCCLAVLAIGSAWADEKAEEPKLKDLLIGKWASGKTETLEFTKEGKMTMGSGKGKVVWAYEVIDEKTIRISRTVSQRKVEQKVPLKVNKDELQWPDPVGNFDTGGSRKYARVK